MFNFSFRILVCIILEIRINILAFGLEIYLMILSLKHLMKQTKITTMIMTVFYSTSSNSKSSHLNKMGHIFFIVLLSLIYKVLEIN